MGYKPTWDMDMKRVKIVAIAIATLTFKPTFAFFSLTTINHNSHNHNFELSNEVRKSLLAPLQQMSAHRQSQKISPIKPVDGAKHDFTKRIAIVGVTCSTLDKSSYLQSGVVELFKLYFEELYELGCDLGFQGFQSEWADLPGKYDFDKQGGLFVAIEINLPTVISLQSEEEKSGQVDNGGILFVPPGSDLPEFSGKTLKASLTDALQVVGCIAIRPLTDTCGEVKRMYIRKSHRRLGLGKVLANAIMEQGWEQCKFNEIKLDSLERLVGAVKLYENMGFHRIEPYCDCPEDDHVCMNLFKN